MQWNIPTPYGIPFADFARFVPSVLAPYGLLLASQAGPKSILHSGAAQWSLSLPHHPYIDRVRAIRVENALFEVTSLEQHSSSAQLPHPALHFLAGQSSLLVIEFTNSSFARLFDDLHKTCGRLKKINNAIAIRGKPYFKAIMVKRE